MAANKDCERQRQTMAKVESHPMKESPMNAHAGPTCPIVLKSFRVFWTDNHFIRMIFGQFHQHFTHGFFIWKFCAQLFFTYILGLYFLAHWSKSCSENVGEIYIFGQFHQQYLSAVEPIFLRKKSSNLECTYKKFCVKLSHDRAVHKMLVKLTPCRHTSSSRWRKWSRECRAELTIHHSRNNEIKFLVWDSQNFLSQLFEIFVSLKMSWWFGSHFFKAEFIEGL